MVPNLFMFIRIKNIKNQQYAYKVRNKWTKKGTRQKTAGYLGKVFRITPQKELDFKYFVAQDLEQYFMKNSSQTIIIDLFKCELIRHGFVFKGNNKNILLYYVKSEDKHNNQGESVDLDPLEKTINSKQGRKTKEATLKVELAPSILSITDMNKPIVLSMNNDFLCNRTLRKLVRFKSFSVEEECGKELAKAFIAAGIPITPKIFVEVFRQVYSKYGSYVK